MLLSSHSNVYNTCLRILNKKGFVLKIEEYDDDENEKYETLWIAEKNGAVFKADNPIELLGLTFVYEFVDPKEDKSYWWTVKGEDIWDELSEHKIYDKNINKEDL